MAIRDNRGIYHDQYVWDDMRVELSAVRGGSYTNYMGGSVLTFPPAGFTADFTIQMSHQWDHRTPIEPHMHCVWETNAAGNVEMEFTYSWADIGSVFPSPTSDTKVFASPQVANRHSIFGFDDPNPLTNNPVIREVSSILICSIRRTNGAADTYPDDIYLLSFDFHYLKASNGSRFSTAR